MIVFLTEEPSIEPVIRKLMITISSSSIEGLNWKLVAFQGKADLEKNFPKKMTSWNYNSPHFIIIRDNDGADCIKLKKRLLDEAEKTEKPYHIRIVCQELEGWLLGDLAAVMQAYPKSKAIQFSNKEKYRNPDTLNNASEMLGNLTGAKGKVSRAENISNYLSIEANRSTSFKVLVKTLKALNS